MKCYASVVSGPVYAVIGDLVASRRSASRAATQRALVDALEVVRTTVPVVDRLEPTVGDEFQGTFATLADATLAALLVRLLLGEDGDARCGIGAGAREVFDADRVPLLQDGPAWWSARAALEHLDAPAQRLRRTWYDPGDDGPPPGPVNAFLLTRDALVDRLGDRARSMLLRSLQGASQKEIAAAEGVSESAVSQAFARGVGAVREAHAVFADSPRRR
jgi:DNA-binding CsgD family transcriptional regulator